MNESANEGLIRPRPTSTVPSYPFFFSYYIPVGRFWRPEGQARTSTEIYQYVKSHFLIVDGQRST